MTKQPPPTKSPRSRPVVPSLIAHLRHFYLPSPELEATIARIKARRLKGIATYGMELHTHDGRDSKVDLQEEEDDAMVYRHKIRMEVEDEEGRI